jgi:hypothetical protein
MVEVYDFPTSKEALFPNIVGNETKRQETLFRAIDFSKSCPLLPGRPSPGF